MAKRSALVVDDSKSARLALRRMLEKYDLEVDTVESAAAALDYLSGQRPDVIFMDHMMPGMDGFEAVRRIKGNPDTATIPVMMYTSKGGDLYLSQARALGAVGILPKTVAPAELYATLQRLGLVEERRRSDRPPEEDGTPERTAGTRRQQAPAAAGESLPVRQPARPLDTDTVRSLLEEQSVEMRKDMLLGIESATRQIHDTLGRELADLKQALSRSAHASPLPVILLAVLLFVSLAWNYSLQKNTPSAEATAPSPVMGTNNATAAADTPAAPGTGNSDDARNVQREKSWALAEWAANHKLTYAFDELALDNQRLDLVRELTERLRTAGFRGRLILETHVGEFCLVGNTTDGFRLAPPDLPVTHCDFIGNPVQPIDLPSAHQSLRFANFLGSASLKDDGIEVEVVNLSRETALAAYPAKSEKTTAGEWNRAARLNNRVRVWLEPS